MKYLYQARDKEGKIETGTVEASTKEAAALLLQKYDIVVTNIKEENKSFLKGGNIEIGGVSKKDLAIFARELAVMLDSRVPVVQSLKSLALQTKRLGFREKIGQISQLVEEGTPLSEACEKYPEVFNLFFTSLLKTGEASGKISESLQFLSDHLEREDDIVSQVRGALIYPGFVIGVLVVVMGIVVFFVMPRLVDLIQQSTGKPPLITLVMIGFYTFVLHYGWILLVAFLLLVTFVIYYLTTKEGRKHYDKLSLQAPFFGSFLKKIFLVRFAENISTLIGAGLSINRALEITRDTVDNSVYKDIINQVEQGVSDGQRISAVLVRYPTFIPPFVIEMIQVGEETGKLDRNLKEIVNFYNKEVNRALELFTQMLEPVLIIFLGLVVAFLAISVIEPLYGSLSSLS